MVYFFILNILLALLIIEKLIGVKTLYQDLKENGFKHIGRQKALQVLEYADIKKNGLKLDSSEIQPYVEQYIHRMIMCEGCVENEKCLSCKCPMKKLLATPNAKCDIESWHEMMLDQDNWNDWKEVNLKGLKLGYNKI